MDGEDGVRDYSNCGSWHTMNIENSLFIFCLISHASRTTLKPSSRGVFMLPV